MGWIMTDYFVDSTTGSDLDDGTTMDLAWATLEYAWESGSLSAGDTVWVRRVHAEAAIAGHMVSVYDGTPSNPIRTSGWPRNADATADGATWTNGSTTVDLVTTLSMDREKHVGRYVTAPNGETYMITYIVDANTFKIDNEYAGPTVTTTSGAFTIQADENYDTAQAIDDSGWTIDVAAWTADADDVATIDIGGGGYHLRPGNFAILSNIEFTNSGAEALILLTSNASVHFLGCIFYHSANDRCFEMQYWTTPIFRRCIFHGDGQVADQYNDGILPHYYSLMYLTDCALYNLGNNGISASQSGSFVLDNVNIGVEIQNFDADIDLGAASRVYGTNVKLGGTAGDVELTNHSQASRVSFENYGKVLGAHKEWNAHGTITKTDVVAGSGDPYKRAGGADSVLELLYNSTDTTDSLSDAVAEFMVEPVFTHEFEATVDRRRYRYYVQAEGAVLASELWMEVEYVNSYGDATTEYVIKRLTSDEAITQRVDASDWSQYIEVDNITPALASKVRVKVYCSYYHATNKIYIDPLPEVTV
jgi:hypothetical protein